VERTSIWRRSLVLRCPYAAQAFTRGDFRKNLCDSHTLCVAVIVLQVAGPLSDGRECLFVGQVGKTRAVKEAVCSYFRKIARSASSSSDLAGLSA